MRLSKTARKLLGPTRITPKHAALMGDAALELWSVGVITEQRLDAVLDTILRRDDVTYKLLGEARDHVAAFHGEAWTGAQQ